MSIFAGFFCFGKPQNPAQTSRWTDSIKKSISRHEGEEIESWQDSRFFIAKVDISAFSDIGFIANKTNLKLNSITSIAGHPYLDEEIESSSNRTRHLQAICTKLELGHSDIFKRCNGTFALCHYNAHDARMFLATDHLGSRPLYYAICDDVIYFSTALRVLEALQPVPKQLDIQGIAESIALTIPLGARTRYADIKILENGTFLNCTARSVESCSYFTWDTIGPSQLTEDQLLDESYQAFLSGVARRSQADQAVVSTLSGGLDSRCVVTALHALHRQIYAVTWAPHGYVDGELAREYGKKLQLKQLFKSLPAMPTWQDQMRCIQNLAWSSDEQPENLRLVFSGDGGSVGVGYDYLTDERISWMRCRQKHRVIEHFAGSHVLLKRFMRRDAYNTFHEAVVEGLRTEFASIKSHDPGRDLHIFYMKNDQRRHLHEFFEDIDICRVEYHLPFYDARFLKLLIAGEVDSFLYHKFYHKWLTRFPNVITTVPWQTYPGHLPCPIKSNVVGRRQWDKKRSDRFRGKNSESFRRCLASLFSKAFPTDFVHRPHVFAAILLHGLRARCYSHVFNACNVLHDSRKNCTASG